MTARKSFIELEMARGRRERARRERFLSKAIINWETGCWEWSGYRDRDGYGIAYTSRNIKAHRAVYELIESPIPEGLHLDHLCRVRYCVNPAHLEPVTSRQNTLRSPIAPAVLNAAKTNCAQGHEFTPENTYTSARGHRHCRACGRADSARYRLRRSARKADVR